MAVHKCSYVIKLTTSACFSWKLRRPTLTYLYTCLVRSAFEYPAIIAPILSDALIIKLQVIQNAALRAITHSNYDPFIMKQTSTED